MVDYVQGKPFDRMEVLQASRNLLALGRTTQDLKGDIELLGRAVVYTGRDFASLALIYGQASASNRVMSGDLNQLVTAGIPILKTLSKQLGVTAQDVYKMAENGQIDFATFKKAVEVFFAPFDFGFDIGAHQPLAEGAQHFADHVAAVAAAGFHGF